VQRALLRALQALLTQMAQTAVCNQLPPSHSGCAGGCSSSTTGCLPMRCR
jgi:hypothetical protein